MGLYRSMVALLARRPWLLPSLLGLAWATRRRHWYRQLPFLPLPPAPYVAWRMETAYGDRAEAPGPGEAARYLAWAARMRKESG
jgi:hypothetical protein